MEKSNAIVDLLHDDIRRTTLFIVLSAVSLVISYAWGKDLAVDPAWIAIILCGFPILYEAVTGLVLRHDIKADVLVAVAIVASLLLQEYFAAGEVAFIMELGGLLEDISADRSRAGIEKLVDMVPTKANLIKDGKVVQTDAGTVEIGDTVRVLPGETVPLDGRVVSGSSYVDQSSLTGEPVPVGKSAGEEVYSGTINQLGTFDMEVTCTAEESSFQKLVDMVESTDAEKTRIVRIADRAATYLVALVFVIAALTYVLTNDVYRTLTVMIVFCPCAFILATPTAVVAAIGNLSKHGILVRDGDSLEKMAAVDRIVFDKTGTLTEGRPTVTGVFPSEGHDEDEVLWYAGTLEKTSEHPFARAILEKCVELQLGDSVNSEITVGGGIKATIDGKTALIGNASFTGSEEMDTEGPDSVIYVSVDGKTIGSIHLNDSLRPNVKDSVSEIRINGSECIMLTGDSERSAAHIASVAGITEHVSGCRPENKLENIRKLQDEGHRVCMIGDGINDAPSLKAADVGVAMGSTGSGITIDVADMVIVGDEINKIPHLQYLSRKMLSRIKLNITFGMCWNVMAVALAVTGIVGAVQGAIVHNVGSVAVVLSSFLLLFAGKK